MQPDASRSNRSLKCLPVLLFIAAIPLHAYAQVYPNKPLRMLVPYPPGGASDVIARILGQHMAETFRQQVIIDNRAGANGMIATQLVAQAAPDGYTLLMSNVGPSAINPSIYAKVPYDAIKDFAPVSLTHVVPLMLVVNSTLGVNSVAELVTRAKAALGKLTYGTGGTGTAGHMAMELFMPNAGIRMERVSYKGDGLALNDILGNQITTMFTTAISGEALVQSGRLKALAVTTAKRSFVAPEVPTMQEAGLAGYEISSWQAMFAPAGLPKEIHMRVYTEVAKALRSPEVVKRLQELGLDAGGMPPEDLAAVIREDIPKLAKIVRDSGAKVD